MTLMRGVIGPGKERAVYLDEHTHGIIAVDPEHDHIHRGEHFVSMVSDNLTSNGQRVAIAMALPGWVPWDNDEYDTEYHVTVDTWCSGPHSFGIYEGVTSFTGGTVQAPMNSNRMVGQSGYEHDYVTEADVTVGNITRTGGSLILPLRYGGGGSGGGNLQGSSKRAAHELVLRAGSTYIFDLVILATASMYCGIELTWYEHKPHE